MKTEKTLAIERALMIMTEQNRTFGCPEVTIGWYGKQRVDFMEANTRKIIKCYEVKVSKADFRSEHGHNFVGNYNYYAMTKDLYNAVKSEIPPGIGVLVLGKKLLYVAKKATYRKITNTDDLIMYLLRSMSREVKKSFDSTDLDNLAYWKRECIRNRKLLKTIQNELKQEKNKKKTR